MYRGAIWSTEICLLHSAAQEKAAYLVFFYYFLSYECILQHFLLGECYIFFRRGHWNAKLPPPLVFPCPKMNLCPKMGQIRLEWRY